MAGKDLGQGGHLRRVAGGVGVGVIDKGSQVIHRNRLAQHPIDTRCKAGMFAMGKDI